MINRETIRRGLCVAVVDPSAGDYGHLAGEEARWQFFGDGKSALRGCRPTRADLWLIASRLPDMTGLELHRLLRSHVGKTPLFLVAAQYDPIEELAALSAGDVHYMCKPFPAALLEQVRQDVARARTGIGAHIGDPHDEARRRPERHDLSGDDALNQSLCQETP